MLLLITGCISVAKKTPFVSVRDESIRLGQYLNTLRWAIESSPFDEVVFCDNSGYAYNFDGYVKSMQTGKAFEYITFLGNSERCALFGKGYGEGEIIKYAMEHSNLLKKSLYFYKLTGKLTIENIDSIVTDIPENRFMNYCERIDKVDTKFYKVKTSDYIHFLQAAYLNVNDQKNVYLERSMRTALKSNKIKYKPFAEIPIVVGVSGTTGHSYKRPSERRLKLYNFLCRTGMYNFKFMYPVDWLLNRIDF